MVLEHDPRPERGELPDYHSMPAAVGIATASTRASVRTWGYLFETVCGRRARRFSERSLTTVSRNPMSSLHAFVDEMVLVYFDASSDVPDTANFVRLEGEIEALIEAETAAGLQDNPMLAHPTPPAPDARIRHQSLQGHEAEWLTFESQWEPLADSPGRVRWMADRHNGVVRATMMRHEGDEPRPWLVMVHGAEMGRPFDARMLRAERLHENLGVNIVMPILPKHGPRRAGGEAIRGTFPGVDFVDNYHGISQSVWDVRRTLAWVREQDPSSVGVFGFSLGGYVSATLAALEPDLDALVLGCPAVDLVDLFSRNMPKLRNGKSRLDHLFGRLNTAYRPISPLALPVQIERDRLGLIAAHADRLADPIDHVSRLWHHWDQPEIHWIDSGHVSYFLKSEPLDALERMLLGRGIGHIDVD